MKIDGAPKSAAIVAARGARHPALLVACCLAAGIAMGDQLGWQPALWLVFTGVLTILTACLWLFRRLSWPMILSSMLVLLALGAWRITVEQEGRPAAGVIELTDAHKVVGVFGRLAGVPVMKNGGWRVALDLHAVGGGASTAPLRSRVQLSTTHSLAGFRLGDYVRFQGRFSAPFVRRNPGGFDYARHLYRLGIDATVTPRGTLTHWPQPEAMWSLANLVEPVRRWVRGVFTAHLAAEPAALMLGFLLGDTDRLPPDVFNLFREAGALHLLAVSGTNVWLMIGVFYLPLRLLPLGRRLRALILVAGVILFSYLTRNEPSVVRASLMVVFALAGRLFWRPVHLLNAVGAAAMMILLVAPSHLFRAGFQMSVVAVIAIIVTVPYVRQSRLWPQRRWLRAPVVLAVSSLAATAATMPITAAHFGVATPVGALSSLVMVPLAGVTTQLGVALLAAHALWGPLAGWVAWALSLTLAATVACARFFGGAMGGMIPWSSPSIWVVLHCVVPAVLILNWRHRYRWWRPCAYYLTALLVGLGVRTAVSTPEPSAKLAFLDTGRQRVAAVASGDSVVWLADDPGIDAELQQWVVGPFARAELGAPPPSGWMPWRRAVEAHSTMVTPAGSDAMASPRHWRRFVSPLEGTVLDHRVWADQWATPEDTVILIRDWPDDDSGLCRRLAAVTGPGHVAILPCFAATSWLRAAIDVLRPRCVVLYGNEAPRSLLSGNLSFWRLRYPSIAFHSTVVHGGVVLTWQRHGVRVTPTITDAAPGPAGPSTY
ncbi:MAG: ComEC/Rec2 family competence protein [Candidatus Zixiibacteriota bacterium]